MKLSGDRKLWLLVGLAFGLLCTAWAVLLTISLRHRVPTVPLESARPAITAEARPAP